MGFGPTLSRRRSTGEHKLFSIFNGQAFHARVDAIPLSRTVTQGVQVIGMCNLTFSYAKWKDETGGTVLQKVKLLHIFIYFGT